MPGGLPDRRGHVFSGLTARRQRGTAGDDLQVLLGRPPHHRDVPGRVGAAHRGTGPLEAADETGVGVAVPGAGTDADQHRPWGHGVEERDGRVSAAVMRWILPSCMPKQGGP